MPEPSTDWLSLAQSMRAELVARRRDLHQHPELGFEEVRTAGIVAKELSALGLEVTTGVGKTGVVGVLDGQRDGPTVLVRADMDALPITEANTTDYVSQTPGKMHACGHDGHTAVALGVAKMLAGQREKLAGRVKFVFQPAEEIGEGAFAMLKDGVLENPTPQVSVGLHLWNQVPVGQIGVTAGPIMTSADNWAVTLHGIGGHAALPELTHDPIMAGVQIINALQTIVSRNVSGLDAAVVSATMFHGGEARNVIPPEVQIAGTFRAFKPEVRDLIERRLREIITGMAAAMQCEADINIDSLTPPVVNDPAVTARLRETFSKIAPAHSLRLVDDARWMAAEDMSVFLDRAPGTFLFVGSANPAQHLDYPHHHPRFDFDEDALPIAAGLLATAVADYVIDR